MARKRKKPLRILRKQQRRQGRQIQEIRKAQVQVKRGYVSSVSPLRVKLDGDSQALIVTATDGTTYVVGDVVDVLVGSGVNGRRIIGRRTTTPSANSNVELGYAQRTTNFTQSGVGNSDVTGLSTTVTVGARPIIVEFGCESVHNSGSSGLSRIQIQEGSTVLAIAWAQGAASELRTISRKVRLSPSAGSHTYKINLAQLVSDNSVITAQSTSPAFIQVIEV